MSLTLLDGAGTPATERRSPGTASPCRRRRPPPWLMLSSGNRVDVLVRLDQPGTYQLQLTPGSSQKPTIPGMPDVQYPQHSPALVPPGTVTDVPQSSFGVSMSSLADIPGELEVRPILTVVVAGEPTSMGLPDTLPAFNPTLPPVSKTRTLAFTVERDGLEFISFGVDGHPFDPARRPYQAALGTTEEWTLVNDRDLKFMTHAHVFHIHVNPFKITKINGNPLPAPLWRDTFVLTKTDYDSITFEMNFADFTGKFVEHCHVLAHEDLGMMEAIEVVR